jgi:hypothetical protein
MKRVLIMGLVFPMLTNGQSTIFKESDLLWMMQIRYTPNRSLFAPDLSEHDPSSPKINMTMIAGNRYTIKEYSHLTGFINWGNDDGMMGVMGSVVGMTGLNRTTVKVHYTKGLSPQLGAGIAIGLMKMNFGRDAQDFKGLVSLKIMQTFQDKTSFGMGFSAIRNVKSKADGMVKSWNSWCTQVVNPNIILGVGIEKEDELDPQFRVISKLKVSQELTLAGGWLLENGCIDLAILRQKKNFVQALHMSNHPLLGYGLEIMLQYGWH